MRDDGSRQWAFKGKPLYYWAKDQKPGDYSDPGWYAHPPGTVAWEWTGALPPPVRQDSAGGQAMPAGPSQNTPPGELNARKPHAHDGNH